MQENLNCLLWQSTTIVGNECCKLFNSNFYVYFLFQHFNMMTALLAQCTLIDESMLIFTTDLQGNIMILEQTQMTCIYWPLLAVLFRAVFLYMGVTDKYDIRGEAMH